MSATPTSQELAVRAVILSVAPDGTLLVKSASPGRLYDPITVAELASQISALLPASATVNGLKKDRKTFELSSGDILAGKVTLPNSIVLYSELVVWNGTVLDSDTLLSGDYYVSGTDVFFGTSLLPHLEVGDKIVVRYEYAI